MRFNIFRRKTAAGNAINSGNIISKTHLEIPTRLGEIWEIPKFEIDSGIEGPTFFLTSGIHGDEISGNVILLKFCNYFKKNKLKRGKIIALVGINQNGIKKLTREIPETGEDLNRLFPGKKEGTVGEKIAYKVSTEILQSNPDLCIDIHNDYFFSTPYILLDPKTSFKEENYKRSVFFAQSTKLNVIQEREDELEKYQNALSAFLISKNIPSFTVEAGPDKLILKKHVNHVFESLLNILHTQKMIDKFNITINKSENKAKKNVLSYGLSVKTGRDGVVSYVAEPGEYVKKGDVIAKIYNEFGENLKNILSTEDAFVLGHSEKTLVEADEEIYWFAN